MGAATTEETPTQAAEKKDPFEEIDFGSFFQDYLDPGYRTHSEMEEIERPSFENFLSKPSNLTDHLSWQLGALSLRPQVREAADLIIGARVALGARPADLGVRATGAAATGADGGEPGEGDEANDA